MKIYILGSSNYEGLDVESVFSSKQKALDALPYCEYFNESDIHEFDLDPEYKGEKFEDYFYVNIDPNVKEIVWGGMRKMRPKEFKEFLFVLCDTLTRTTGYGKTYEEAKSNAEKAQLELHPIWQVGKGSSGEISVRHPHPSTLHPWDIYGLHEDYNEAKIALDDYLYKGIIGKNLRIS